MSTITMERDARERRRTLVAFGALCLASDDLDALRQTACLESARCLGADFTKISTPAPGTHEYLVIAGHGWPPGVVGGAMMQGDHGSNPGYTEITGHPVLSPDVDGERRFEHSELLREFKVRSTASVLIRRARGRPYGVLEADSLRLDAFDDDDVDFLQSCANLLGAAIERHEITQQLTAARDQNAMLLAELQHRVKNNFAAISAMLQLQLRQSQGPARAALDLVRTRIEALSLANQQLLEGRTVGPIDLARYLGSLADNLRTFNDLSTHRIELDLVVVPCRVPAAVAGSLGLLINEFVTNSAKHAFPGNRPGHIRIELQSSAAEFVVHLTDDGVGLPARAHESPGMGLRLMQSLAHQVEGELLWIEEQVGSHVVVRVPYRSD